jgi:hypothetical protein
MLGECQGANLPFGIQRMCRSRRVLCSCPYVVRDKYIFVESYVWTFFLYALTKKSTSCRFFLFPVGSFCSRSECEKRKAIWETCVAEIKQDPGQQKDFDTKMLAVLDQMG